MELSNLEKSVPGEHEAIDKLIEMLSAKMLREKAPSEKMKRDAHPKQVGLLKATFTVLPGLDPELRVGIFEKPKSYSAWVRFSNQNAPPAADHVKDIRGMAVKIMGVEGVKVLERERDAKTQDFILISTNKFVTRNVVDFAKLIGALTRGKLRLLLFFLFHPKITYNLVSSNKNFGSLLEARFWSVSPYTFGARAVKYSLVPQSPERTAIPSKPADNYLTAVMERQLGSSDYYFDFMIQFQKDRDRMHVEDLSNPWSEDASPFIKVATLMIPKQAFNTDERKAYGDNLSFTPWHCLVPHKPLGNINRGRKAVYDALSKYRHTTNGLPLVEPEEFTIV